MSSYVSALKHNFFQEQQDPSDRASRATRRGQAARPSQDRERARPFSHRRDGRSGPHSLEAERFGDPSGITKFHRRAFGATGVSAGVYSAHW